MLEGARLEGIFGLKYKGTLLTGALCSQCNFLGRGKLLHIPERHMVRSRKQFNLVQL